MLNWIAPHLFPSYENFLQRYTWDGKDARNVKELRETLKSLFLRRRKKDVLPDLPPINRMWQWHELSEAARIAYKDVLVNGVYRELLAHELGTARESDVTSILAQILRLKQICAQDKVDHTSDLAIDLFDSSEGVNGGAGKVIVFSQFKSTVHAIARRLAPEAVTITGDLAMNQRTVIQDKFQEDPNIHFLVATWQTSGEGLNLTAADYVIFNDLFWRPGDHQQCEERAYGRLNDLHPIDSYYIAADQTIENWIQELLASKLRVIEQVVEGVNEDRNPSIAMDLIRKLREEMRNERGR